MAEHTCAGCGLPSGARDRGRLFPFYARIERKAPRSWFRTHLRCLPLSTTRALELLVEERNERALEELV